MFAGVALVVDVDAEASLPVSPEVESFDTGPDTTLLGEPGAAVTGELSVADSSTRASADGTDPSGVRSAGSVTAPDPARLAAGELDDARAAISACVPQAAATSAKARNMGPLRHGRPVF